MFENVRTAEGNICTDREHTYIYTFDLLSQSVLQKDKTTGAVQASYPTDTLFTEVFSLEFDGYYWWTLEAQGGGITVRRWEKTGVFVVLDKTFSFSSSASLSYDSKAMAVEYYSTFITIPGGPGVSFLDVDDVSDFRPGDEIIIGPSMAGGYTGDYNKATILNVDELNSRLNFDTPLSSRFNANDYIYSPRAFWILNSGLENETNGSLIKLNAKSGNIIAIDYKTLYKNVEAATFFQGFLLFIRGNEVFWINTSSFNIVKVMAIDNLRDNRSSMSIIYDLYGFDNNLYRLQKEVAYLSAGNWLMESWSTFNTVVSKTEPEVYMLAVKVDRPVIHAISSPLVTTASSTVFCTVYDQYFSPVFGQVVNFFTDGGSVSPIQAITDVNGACKTHYTGDSSVGLVTITASTD